MRCRAQPQRARRRSATGIYGASPSAGAWAVRGCRDTTGALWWSLTSRAGFAANPFGSVTYCYLLRTIDKLAINLREQPTKVRFSIYRRSQLILDPDSPDGLGRQDRRPPKRW